MTTLSQKLNKLLVDRADLDLSLSRNLQKSILQEAIQGKLVAQDPTDEPASVLIERIREEKKRLLKEGKLKKKDITDSVIYKDEDNKYYEQIEDETIDITEDIPFDIPVNWEWCRLNGLCSIFTGATFKKEDVSEDNSGVRILRGGNISPFKLRYKPDDIFLSKELVKESILLRKNDIVTPAVTSLENIGKAARIESDLQDITVGGFVFIMRPFSNEDDLSKYVLSLLAAPSITDYIRSITNKSGQAFYNIGKERLLKTLVPLPPLQEMQRIVEQVEVLFDKLK